MTRDLWKRARQSNTPRVVALGLFRRAGDQVLVTSFRDGVTQHTLHRPPGGGVHFGESAREALTREMREEFGQESRIGEQVGVFEDIFLHEGQPGHEIVFVFDAVFDDQAPYQQDELTLTDYGGIAVPARWAAAGSFAPAGPHFLCPPGLADVLQAPRARDLVVPEKGDLP